MLKDNLRPRITCTSWIHVTLSNKIKNTKICKVINKKETPVFTQFVIAITNCVKTLYPIKILRI